MSKSDSSKEYTTLLRRLKQARKDAGLSQADVASKLNKHQSYISKIESGERRIDIVETQKLASIYNKDLRFFTS